MSMQAARGKERGLIILGDSAFAEIAYEYFQHDSRYEVAAFAVERAFLKRDTLMGLPVIAFEDLSSRYPAHSHDVYAAIVYSQLNRLRTRIANAAKQRGYALASYISSKAYVWPNVKLGEHCFIFENNVLQPFVTIGNNVVLWSGNHIGHHSRIHDNVFVTSHVVLSGFCEVGENSFLGGNAMVANNVRVARDCWIGPGVVISRDTLDGALYRAMKAEPSKVSAPRFFRVADG
jgi:sugar O-acyltransferase (sialic acid O-acetyltransferase NeuD family)